MLQKISLKIFIILLLIFLAILSLIGAIIYKLYALNFLGIALALILSVVATSVWWYFYQRIENTDDKPVEIKKMDNHWLTSLFFILLAVCFCILLSYRTDLAINSPWQVLPIFFFVAFFLLTTVLFINILRQDGCRTIIVSFYFLLCFSVALIIYKIGYGFDPFIHQATEDLIANQGFVNPKPWYYLGQYSLVVILNKITFIPIDVLDKILVPFLAAVVLPISMLISQNYKEKYNKSLYFATIFLMIWLAPIFIVTTPQNLSFLILITVIFYSLKIKNLFQLITLGILALSASAIHPLTGIPAIFLVFLIYIIKFLKLKYIKIAYLLTSIVAAITLPLLFYWIESKNLLYFFDYRIAGEKIILLLANFKKINFFAYSENWLLNTINFFDNFKWIGYFSLIGMGLFYNRKNINKYLPHLSMALAMFVAYLLSLLLPFSYLIDYEQSAYSQRIFFISLIFMLPISFVALKVMFYKILQQNLIVKCSWLFFLLVIVTAAFYLAYPRSDNYQNSHNYAVSADDIEAVKFIENDSMGAEYLVLANQQVSAAALRVYGFSRYYQDFFYYPLPTSGRLYQLYLNMVYDNPSRETMVEAMNLLSVNRAYLVLNKYWWAFDKIKEEAKISSDHWFVLPSQNIYIFKFQQN